MNIIKILFYILAIPLGVFMFVYAEIDDSPGGQLIGVVMMFIGIYGIVSKKKKV